MSQLVNAKPRFGLEGDKIYDYLESRYIPLTEGLLYSAVEGTWDLNKVAELINKGVSIESALTPTQTTSPEVSKANADFITTMNAAQDEKKEAAGSQDQEEPESELKAAPSLLKTDPPLFEAPAEPKAETPVETPVKTGEEPAAAEATSAPSPDQPAVTQTAGDPPSVS